jgi:hypothetical protein
LNERQDAPLTDGLSRVEKRTDMTTIRLRVHRIRIVDVIDILDCVALA